MNSKSFPEKSLYWKEFLMQKNTHLDCWSPYALGLLRVITALLFLAHGVQKFWGFPAPSASGIVQPFTIFWFGGMLELLGGLFLMVGFLTRPTAFVVSGMMAVAYWMFHFPKNIFPILNGGDASILYCFIFLYLVFAGPGAWSIDGLRKQKS